MRITIKDSTADVYQRYADKQGRGIDAVVEAQLAGPHRAPQANKVGVARHGLTGGKANCIGYFSAIGAGVVGRRRRGGGRIAARATTDKGRE